MPSPNQQDDETGLPTTGKLESPGDYSPRYGSSMTHSSSIRAPPIRVPPSPMHFDDAVQVAPLSPRSPKKKFSVLWGNKEDGVSEVHASLLETRLWLQEELSEERALLESRHSALMKTFDSRLRLHHFVPPPRVETPLREGNANGNTTVVHANGNTTVVQTVVANGSEDEGRFRKEQTAADSDSDCSSRGRGSPSPTGSVVGSVVGSNNGDNGRRHSRQVSKASGSMVSTVSKWSTQAADDGWLRKPPPLHDREDWHRWVEELVTSIQFEMVFGSLIIANAVVLAIQRQYEGDITGTQLLWARAETAEGMAARWPAASLWFEALEWIFGCAVALEVVIKIAVLRCRYIQATWWNLFDLVIACIWVMDRVRVVLVSLNPTMMRLARIARLMRILRILRWLTLVDNLVLLVKSIQASITVLMWAMMLMLIVISIVAMAVSSMIETWIRDENNSDADRLEVYLEWGTFTRAMVTMFEITLADWGPSVRLLSDKVNEWWAFIFLIYKLTVGFAVVEVIISVFIQQTFKVASRDEEIMIREQSAVADSYVKHVTALFSAFDESGDGMISWDEFSKMQHDVRLSTWLAALGVETHEVTRLFDLLDDGDGAISQEEFLRGVKMIKGGAKGSDMLFLCRESKKTGKLIKRCLDKVERLASQFAVLTGKPMRWSSESGSKAVARFAKAGSA